MFFKHAMAGFSRRPDSAAGDDFTYHIGLETVHTAGAVPVSGTSISSGDPSGHFEINSGNIRASVAGIAAGFSGSPYTIVMDDGQTITINAVANARTVANLTEFRAATTAIGSAGGKTVIPQGEGFIWDAGTRLLRNTSYTSTLIVDGYNFAKFDRFDQENAQNWIWRNTEVHYNANGGSNSVVNLIGANDNFEFTDNVVHGVFVDPFTDLSAAGAYPTLQGTNKNGINTAAGASGQCKGGVIARNLVYDVSEGIVAIFDGASGITVTDNEIFRTYSDAMKFIILGSALTASKEFSRNIYYLPMGDPADADNPHIDFLQFISSAANDGLAMTNTVIRQNICWEDKSQSRGQDVQGMVSFDDNGNQVLVTGAIVTGNVMLTSGNHHCTFANVDGGLFAYNTFAQPSETSLPASQAGGRLNFGFRDAGAVPTVRNNIVEVAAVGAGVTDVDSVLLGKQGATIAYATCFDGDPGFDPVSFAEVKTQFSRKDAGPADGGADSLPGSDDAGALGSGFGVYGLPRTPGGWSFDSAYENASLPAVSASLLGNSTDGTAWTVNLATNTTGDELAILMCMNPDKLPNTPAGWTLARHVTGVTNNVDLMVFTKTSAGETSVSFTAAGTPGVRTWVAATITDAGPITFGRDNNGFSTTATALAITAIADALGIAFFGSRDDLTATDTPFADSFPNIYALAAVDYDSLTAGSTGNKTATVSSSTAWVATLMQYLPVGQTSVASEPNDKEWSVATGAAAQVDLTLTRVPTNGGSAITDFEYSTDAGVTWASLGIITPQTVAITQESDTTALVANTSYNFQLRAVNAVGNSPASEVQAATSGVSGYTANLVDTNGTAYLDHASSTDAAELTFSIWHNPTTISGTGTLYHVSGRTRIRRVGDDLSVEIRDTLGNFVYSGNSTNPVFSAGVEAHIYISVNLSTPSITIEVNGVTVAMTDSTPIATGSGSIDFTRAGHTLFCDSAFTTREDCIFSDFGLWHGEVIANSNLYNSGTKQDVSGFGTPEVLLAGTATDNNAGTHSGSLTLTVGSATFTAG